MSDFEIIVLNQHKKILRRQSVKEAILLYWAQGRDFLELWKIVNRAIVTGAVLQKPVSYVTKW